MYKIATLLLLILNSVNVLADNVPISISAPKQVAVNETFHVSYEIGTQNISNFEAPDFGGFHLIDSRQSSSSSTTIINGEMTTKSSTTITFILSAPREGRFTIGPAKVYLNGTAHPTKQIPITVVAGSPSNNNTPPSTPPSFSNHPTPNTPQNPQNPNTSSDVHKDKLFVRAIVSKSKAYEQEAILLTYKIYASPELYVTGFQGKLPVLNSFHIQELEPDRNQQSEYLNGKPYNTAVWRQYVLYPQSNGSIEIPSIKCEATVSVQNGYMDPFGMFPRSTTELRELQTNSLEVEVIPLPTPPSNFYGAVGDFNLSSSINKRKFKSGDILSLKLNITGVGNLKLIETPTVEFPSNFETYDSKVNEDYELTASGHEGSKTFEFHAVPKNGGKYTIAPVEFTYFDPTSQSYKTLKSQSYEIDVTADPNQTYQNEVDELEKDIKHIKLGDVELRQDHYKRLYSWKWITAYAISSLLFILLYIGLHRKFSLNSTSPSNKRRIASKLVMRQLEKSRELMAAGKEKEFHIELLNALYSFPKNKLNITNEEFNKENVRQILENQGVSTSVIDEYMALVDECEFTRYSSGASNSTMDSYYNKAIDIISKLENSMK